MLKTLKCCWKSQDLFLRHYAKNIKTEMKYLNVAEKHDAAKTIAGLLSNGAARRREGYSVYNKIFDFDSTVKGRNCKMVMTSVSGHLQALEFLSSYRNWRNVDPEALFDAPVRKVCPEDYEGIKRTLEREIRSCNGLIVWTDCDREGENIGFEIVDVCRSVKPNITVYRAIFSEITAVAVKRALMNLTTPDKRQSDAVDVRTEMDLRTGAAITRFQTLRFQRLFPEKIADKLISYGSCQIPTLGFVAERYKEVEAFVSEPFWKLKVIHTIDDLTVDFNWARNRLFDKQAVEDYLLLCLADPMATVESAITKPKNKWRPQPMDTVEMEKLGSRKLKLSAKETMTIAEKLYTKGIISYPRTETNMFSKEFDLRSLVEQQTGHNVWGSFAQRVVEWGPNPRNGNKSDKAHPPIHPTKLVTDLQGNEGRVYELICRHFLACVSKDATGMETVVHINIAGEKFTATGLCIHERNYLDVYIYEKWNAKQIHKYEQGQQFEPTEISMQEGATTAPPLLTEADLIALMEKHGIGTDATHADHINTIKERGYIGVVDNGHLVPGIIGMGLYEGYDAMELALAKPKLRAEFEADLKKICLGEKDPKTVLREQVVKYKEAYKQIMDKITAMDEKVAQRLNETPVSQANTDGSTNTSNIENNPNRLQELFKCPKCNVADLALRQKKNQSGHFIGCINFPDCKNVVWLPDDCKEYVVLSETCSRCGPSVKLLKFKFQSALHKTMFNAPFGWYKTCLRCDVQFRDTFNINIDNIKAVGGIVGDTSSSLATPSPTIAAGTATRPANIGRSNPNDSSSTRRPSTDKSKKTNPKKPKGNTGSETVPKPTKKKTSTAPKNTKGNKGATVRSYFTSASTSQSAIATNQLSEQIATEQLSGVHLDEFFNSNDSFDDVMLQAEAAVTSNATSNTRQAVTLEVLDEDIAAAFAADDMDDAFSESNWGTGVSDTNLTNRQTTGNASTNSLPIARELQPSGIFNINDEDEFCWGSRLSGNSINNRSNVGQSRYTLNQNNVADNEFDFNAVQRQPVNLDELNDNWGSKGKTRNSSVVGTHNTSNVNHSFNRASENENMDDFDWSAVRRSPHMRTSGDTPAAKRPRLQPDNSFSKWKGKHNNAESGGSAEITQNVKCTGCQQLAKQLTVRKDGPNKNRLFFVCPNPDQCKFFQWADEQIDTIAMQRSNLNSSQINFDDDGPSNTTVRPANNWYNDDALNTSREAVKCKCGQVANDLTVRKEGPNKGRKFYACPNRDNSCNFFQWRDDDDDDGDFASTSSAAQSNFSWGSGSRGGSQYSKKSNTSNQEPGEPKKRKCGLCRQEGHTKLKCPRKSEFQY